ncbi:hypothetical protein EVAR_18124_1 [Eumeta japonica]|uniref:Glucuronosyltransferase n=1 Tax=Eumeta variegata TaxID=151549 RepID=A0A4C1VK38_EUMVA|nr:hypothetical protein EVAR_18124_1 [Eumeta japonica]
MSVYPRAVSWNTFSLSQVTYVGPFLEKTTNKKLTQISVAEITSLIKDVHMVTKKDQSWSFVKEYSRNVTIMMMENKEVRAALLKNSYDAVITEWFFSDVHAGFASVLQCPWILLSGTQVHPYLEYLMGEVNSPGVYPNGIQDFPIPMNFWQRLMNTAVAGLILASVVRAEPEPDKSIMQLLGGDSLSRDQFGADIHSKISTRWLEMLEKGLDTKIKDDLLKENLPSDNVELLKAPELNYEIKATATKSCHERTIY